MARYCSPSRVDQGVPLATAFKPPEDRNDLSVNWLEYFRPSDREEGVQFVRQALLDKDYRIKKDGRLAVLNVGAIRRAFQEVTRSRYRSLMVLHTPQVDDPSHADIRGYTRDEDDIAQALAELVEPEDVFPAIPE